MQGIGSVVDTSSWPCAYEYAYWALQEPFKQIGTLVKSTENTTVYRITELPCGEFLADFNGLVNISIDPDSFKGMCLKSAQLVLNGRTVESCVLQNKTHTFKLFSKTRVLPRFVFKTLDVVLQHEAFEDTPPEFAIDAVGLLFTIKDHRKPFVVAIADSVVVTWDGTRLYVVDRQASTGYECQYSDPFFFRQQKVHRPQWTPDSVNDPSIARTQSFSCNLFKADDVAHSNSLMEHLARNDEECNAELMWEACQGLEST